MAKFELKFIDCGFDDNYIKVEREIAEYGGGDRGNYEIDSIKIEIYFESNYSQIYLDKSTAIKFAKTLRTEINKIQ